jgi:hypothetical protein
MSLRYTLRKPRVGARIRPEPQQGRGPRGDTRYHSSMPKRSRKKLPNDLDELARSSVDAGIASAEEEGGPPAPGSAAVYTEPDIAPEPVKKPRRVLSGGPGAAGAGAARAKPSAKKRKVKTARASAQAPRPRKRK